MQHHHVLNCQSTRSSTQSLPAKRTTLAEEQAAAVQHLVSNRPNVPKPKPKAARTKSQQSPRSKQIQPTQPIKPKVKQSTTASSRRGKAKAPASPAKTEPPGTGPLETVEPEVVSEHDSTYDDHEQHSRLLSLPPELRNYIYSFALVNPTDPVRIHHSRPYVREPALLRVNQQVRQEAMSVFYREEVFVTEGSVTVGKFLRTADERAIRSLRRVHQTTGQPRSKNDAITRLTMVFREFKSRGLRKDVMRFQINTENGLKWRTLEQML